TSARRNFVHIVLALTAALASLALPTRAAPSQQEAITIVTEKPRGPVVGTFATSGAFADSGLLVTERIQFSAIPAPFGVITHIVQRFEGDLGTFTIQAQIIDTLTDDPNISLDQGTWVIVDGTGAYATLHGTGDVIGTVDDAANLITRVFTGTVHLN